MPQNGRLEIELADDLAGILVLANANDLSLRCPPSARTSFQSALPLQRAFSVRALFLYDSSRRQIRAPLRAFFDFLRQHMKVSRERPQVRH